MPSSEAQPVLQPGDSPAHPLAAWFEDMRRTRQRHYATRPTPRPGERTRAVITMVNNEPVFMPIWLGYYSRFFAPQDIYVLDNETDDGSTAGDGFVRIPVRRGRVDARWTARRLQKLQDKLLERYDMVLVTDVDEIVAPDPRLGTLGDYLDRFDEPWVNCLGYELLHVRDAEAPLRLHEPILAQRRHWYFHDAYNKPALVSQPLERAPGLHRRADGQYAIDPDLRMIHLHRMDYEICLERHRTRTRRRWARHDARRGWALHNLIVDDAEFEQWFYEMPPFSPGPEQIPGPWHGLF